MRYRRFLTRFLALCPVIAVNRQRFRSLTHSKEQARNARKCDSMQCKRNTLIPVKPHLFFSYLNNFLYGKKNAIRFCTSQWGKPMLSARFPRSKGHRAQGSATSSAWKRRAVPMPGWDQRQSALFGTFVRTEELYLRAHSWLFIRARCSLTHIAIYSSAFHSTDANICKLSLHPSFHSVIH